MQDFFAIVDRINECYKLGNHEAGTAASYQLGRSLREAMDNGELNYEQANAIINTIGLVE
jgi:hypothetical protein